MASLHGHGCLEHNYTRFSLTKQYPKIENVADIQKADWSPRLHLTREEREVVEAPGTVLLLGRSGTGKTVCICNRMHYDQQRAYGRPLSQLFVARSPSLCGYVERVVKSTGSSDKVSSSFMNYEKLLRTLESGLPQDRVHFQERNRIDFHRFKREFYSRIEPTGLDALVVWTSIRSFMKGSIEAMKFPGNVLSKADFYGMGKKRVRLSPEKRKIVYSVFQRYEKFMKGSQLWDDCDRITSLIRRIGTARSTNTRTHAPSQCCTRNNGLH
jgi:hypothetical protein